MITEKEVREKIKKVIEVNKHILDCPNAIVATNAVRALMQLETTAKLDALYFVIEEIRPRFECDDH